MHRLSTLSPISNPPVELQASDTPFRSAIRPLFLPSLLALATLLIGGMAEGADKPKRASGDPGLKASELYTTTNVWPFHLQFAADQWEAIQRNTAVDFSRLSRGGPPGGPEHMNFVNPDVKRNGLSGMMGVDFEWGHATLEFGGRTFADVAARFKGNGTFVFSQNAAKKPFKIDLNKYVKGQKLAGLTKLNFANNTADPSYLSDALSFELFREAGVPSPRTAFARLSLTVPGEHKKEYLGLYTLIENIDNNFAEDRFGNKKGAIFKPVTPKLFDFLGDDWSSYQRIYDPKTDLTTPQKQRIIDLARLVSKAGEPEFKQKIGDYLDLDQFARFLAVTVFLSNYDSILAIHQNYYVYLDPKSDKFLFLPWDLDHSFGEFPFVGTSEGRVHVSIDHPWLGENRFLERVMSLEDFRQIYRRHFQEFMTSIFKPEKIHRRIDEVAAAIRKPISEESASRLDRFEQAVSSTIIERPKNLDENPFAAFNGPPHQLKHLVSRRAAAVSDQLAGKSEGQILKPMMMGRPPPGGPAGRLGPPKGPSRGSGEVP